MVIEVAVCNIKAGQGKNYERDFVKASPYIESAKGYISHELMKVVGEEDKYLIMAKWESIEDHIPGFPRSPDYPKWKEMTHHYYDPFPDFHYHTVVTEESAASDQ